LLSNEAKKVKAIHLFYSIFNSICHRFSGRWKKNITPQ
jgi:hypothetical protein